MKNKIQYLIFLVLFTSFQNSFAQNLEFKVPEYTYCQIIGTSNMIGTKVSVSIDYGQSRKVFEDTRIRDEETGKVKKFNSMTDALNYMGEMGWEFVQAYVAVTGSYPVYTYLLKRRLTDEEKKNYIPIIKRNLNEGDK